MSEVDQLEARRGKGLAIKFPLRETEGEKVKREREEIWREKEEELTGPPFFLSSLLPLSPLPPSAPPPPPHTHFFSPLLCLFGRKWKVKGEQEVRHIHLCVVKFDCQVRELLEEAQEGSWLVVVGRLQLLCARVEACMRSAQSSLPSNALAHLYSWYM